jgi:hypothetical protein
MSNKGKKKYELDFAPDETVRVTKGKYKGLLGYVEKIVIDEWSIFYTVILFPGEQWELKPVSVKYPAHSLEKAGEK